MCRCAPTLGLLLLTLSHSSAQVPGPDVVTFSPASNVNSVDFIDDTIEWRIQGSFAIQSVNDTVTQSVPILFFPAPGNGQMTSSQHPCITSPTPCCLFDFADHYTTVGLFEWLQSVSATFNRGNCAGISDFRPIVLSLLGDDSLFLRALGDIRNTSVKFTTSNDQATTRNFEVRVNHWIMQELLATTVDLSNATAGETGSRLYTFAGIMWLRTLPVPDINSGMDVYVTQPQITLDPAPFFLLGLATSQV